MVVITIQSDATVERERDDEYIIAFILDVQPVRDSQVLHHRPVRAHQYIN